MMIVIVLAACLQQAPEPGRAPFRAQLTVERFVKREDGVTLQTGTLSVRPGEALLFESRTLRLLIRDGKAVERRTGERIARRWNPAAPEHFQPVDLWRMTAAEVQALFEVRTDRPAEARDLPASVVTPEGKAVPPAVLKTVGSLAVAEGVDRAEGCARVMLSPRDPKLRARIASIRLSVDRASGLLLRAVVDSPAQILTLTLSEYREVASLDDAVFEMDLSTLKVEDK